MRTYKQELEHAEYLERRLKHLLQSDFIRSFDEVNPYTKEYKRDIKDADIKTVYLCDGKKCGENHDCMECKHTSDIKHAKNFEYDGYGCYWEKSPDQSESVRENPKNPILSESVRNCPKPAEQPLTWIRKNNRYICPICKAEYWPFTNWCSVCETELT